MRIAGNTIRRNYLSRYEMNYTDKYNSEKKIYSGRQFDRGSENPISAARALRVRKSIAEVETHKANLQTADTIYTNAESSMMKISEIIAKGEPTLSFEVFPPKKTSSFESIRSMGASCCLRFQRYRRKSNQNQGIPGSDCSELLMPSRCGLSGLLRQCRCGTACPRSR